MAIERRGEGAFMAKRKSSTLRTIGGTATTEALDATTAEAMERRVLVFAEQLGRMAGTVQAKAEGWMDRERLTREIASVRDGAVNLLEQLAGRATKTSKRKPAGAARRATKGRSGGGVDAPGKKHRKPLPPDPEGKLADSQAAKMRTAMPMAKTSRRRGRG
jgi:hypothetical protein